jgi:hypothetical protein
VSTEQCICYQQNTDNENQEQPLCIVAGLVHGVVHRKRTAMNTFPPHPLSTVLSIEKGNVGRTGPDDWLPGGPEYVEVKLLTVVNVAD